MHIESYDEKHAAQIAEIFYSSIHGVASADYTEAELHAWAPYPIDYAKWRKRLNRKQPIIAVENEIVLGFGELEPDGHVDCFYVHKDHQRRGVGRAIMKEIVKRAGTTGVERLHAEVSITAKPFFTSLGFTVLRPNLVRIGELTLKNYLMEKILL